MSCPRAHSRAPDTPCRLQASGPGPPPAPPQLLTRVPPFGSWGSGHFWPMLLSRSWEPHTGHGRGHGMSLLQRLTSRPRPPSALGCGLLPGEAFWTFLEPVEIPDYGEPSLVREGPWNSASPSGDRPASRWKWCVCAWWPPHTAFHPPSRDQPGSLHLLGPQPAASWRPSSTYCPGLLMRAAQVPAHPLRMPAHSRTQGCPSAERPIPHAPICLV